MAQSLCEVCQQPNPPQARGQPRKYCGDNCSRAAEAVVSLVRRLEANPRLLAFVASQLRHHASIDRSQISDDVLRRLRGDLFTVASTGRRLAPGTSGRYMRKARRDAKAAAKAHESAQQAGKDERASLGLGERAGPAEPHLDAHVGVLHEASH